MAPAPTPSADAAPEAGGPAAAVRRRGLWHAVAGAVAAAVALALGELVTAFDTAGTSLVTAVGDEFVDRFAASLKDLAVALFGTNDKAALVIGIVVVSIGVGAALGVAAARRPWAGAAGFAAFGVLGAWAYQRAPLTSTGIGLAAAVVAAVGGTVGLWALLHRLEVWAGPSALLALSAPMGDAADDGVVEDGVVRLAPTSAGAPTVGGASRRGFLLTAGALSAGAAGVAVLGRRIGSEDPTSAFRDEVVLPEPGVVDAPLGAQPFDTPGLSPYVTPTPDFFRIDTALTIPRVDASRWELAVSGLVERPFTMGFDELLSLDPVEATVTLQCVSNEVGGNLVGNARWQGVPLAALLERAGVGEEATQVVGRSVDGFTAGFPTDLATDGRTAMVAYAMNGEPLSPRHGFPARLIVAGLYGYVSATKWLTEIELTRWEDFDAYWVPRGWAKEGPIKPASRIDVPRAGAQVPAGSVAVAGVAWAPPGGISGVEVRVDEGPWEPCRLGVAAGDETWVQWHLVWEASPGDHVLSVRAIDADGKPQTASVAPPRPDGATGHHARRVRVAAS